MTAYRKYLKVLNSIERAILVSGFVVMLFITFINIVDRKIPYFVLAWSTFEELTCALFMLISLVGAAMAARHGLHLGLSILTDLLPGKARLALTAFSGLCGLFFCGILVIFGAEMVQSEMAMNMRTAALGWPEWVFGSFIPIGAAFMGLEFINYIVSAFKTELQGEGLE